jgi:hypothetical protein
VLARRTISQIPRFTAWCSKPITHAWVRCLLWCKHSPRSRPLKLSTNPFSTGLPGRMKHSCTPLAITPSFQRATAKLGSVFHGSAGEQFPPFYFRSLQCLRHLHPGHRAIRFQTDALPRELIHHSQDLERAAIRELVASLRSGFLFLYVKAKGALWQHPQAHSIVESPFGKTPDGNRSC